MYSVLLMNSEAGTHGALAKGLNCSMGGVGRSIEAERSQAEKAFACGDGW